MYFVERLLRDRDKKATGTGSLFSLYGLRLYLFLMLYQEWFTQYST